MTKAKVEPVVQNVVSFAKLETEGNTELELKLIAEKVSGSRYNKKRFPAVILRKTKPRSTILIFKSGRMIIIGSESQEDAQIAANKISKQIKKLTNKKLKLKDFKVTNIVANADLGHKINIGKLSEIDQLTRKDDSFPGAVYHMDNPVKAVLIFSSGKVVFTGAQKRAQINQAFEILQTKMQPFFKS